MNNLDESQGNFAEPKSQSQKVTCYMIHLYNIYERQNLANAEQISDC